MDATLLSLFLLATVFVLVGLAGIVVPGMPGVPLVFVGLFVAAFAEDFAYVGAGTLIGLGALALVSYVVDLAAASFGVRRFGASRSAVVGALIGTCVGLFFGLPGLLLGPFVGAVAGELVAQRDLAHAGRAGLGAWLGLALGVAARLAIAFSMLAIFFTARLWWR